MTLRRARFWLLAAAVLLGVAAVGVVAAAFAVPVREPKVAERRVAAKPQAAEIEALPPLKAFAGAWSLDLRRPLYDPPPSATAAQSPALAPPLAVSLTGTVVEPGHSLAVFAAPGGRTELKAVGESTGGAEVLSIDRDSAVLLHNGERVTLRVPRPAGG